MEKSKQITFFEGKKIRRVWDEKKELWYFSVIDLIVVLTDQANFQTARKYWNKLKERLRKEGNESVTNCHQLKLLSAGRISFYRFGGTFYSSNCRNR